MIQSPFKCEICTSCGLGVGRMWNCDWQDCCVERHLRHMSVKECIVDAGLDSTSYDLNEVMLPEKVKRHKYGAK